MKEWYYFSNNVEKDDKYLRASEQMVWLQSQILNADKE